MVRGATQLHGKLDDSDVVTHLMEGGVKLAVLHGHAGAGEENIAAQDLGGEGRA